MRIAILGTRGIPNYYGGFEQFAEYCSEGLVKRGHEVYVYNAHNHKYQKGTWKNVNIIHKFDPEYFIGTFGQFIYDLNCIIDSRKRKFDIILQLGYTSSSIWWFLLPRKPVIVSNMDGWEWKRTKYSSTVRRFLKFAERLGANNSDYLISDSIGIQEYLKKEYSKQSTFIPYGAFVFNKPDVTELSTYQISPYSYDMIMARMEPENNIEIVLDGVALSGSTRPFLVIGNTDTSFGKYLKHKFSPIRKIRFLGSLYEINTLNNLRFFSNIYFHGHTVGGTNPSLLEAMSSNALICVHRNPFNISVVGDDAYYFLNDSDVQNVLDTIVKNENEKTKLNNNISKIKSLYNWEYIIDQYEKLFLQSIF